MRKFSDLNWFVFLLGLGGLLFLIVGQKGNTTAQLFGGGVFILTIFYFLRFERVFLNDVFALLSRLIRPSVIQKHIQTLPGHFKKNRLFTTTVLLTIVILFLLFGLHHLGMFMSVDEPKWLNTRVPQLYEALFSGDWESTYINDKPGILPSLLSGITNLFLDKDTFTRETIEDYFFWWRFPILLFNFFSLFLIYYFTRKLTNTAIALATITLTALHPVIIGISQIVNPDATLWNTGFLAFLTFFLYLKTNREKYILYAGLFLGLALISKYFISLFYIIFFLVIYLEYLTLNNITPLKFLRRTWDLLKIYVISIATYVVLFPITWIEFRQVLKGTIGANILTSGRTVMLIFIFAVLFEIVFLRGHVTTYIKKKIDMTTAGFRFTAILLLAGFGLLFFNLISGYSIFDPQYYKSFVYDRSNADFLPALFTSGYVALFTLTLPLLIAFVIFIPIAFSKQKYRLGEHALILQTIVITILVFLVGAALGGFVISARYQIILYPLYALFASIIFMRFIPQKAVAIVVLVIFGATTVYGSAPFYLQYTNSLNVLNTTAMSTWGYGGYELAQQVSKEIGKDKIIWSDREGFKEFYPGNTSHWRGVANPFREELGIEYLVLSNSGERIFNKALKKQLLGKNTFYGREAENTPILSYYKKEPLYKVCLHNNPNHCTWIVEMDKSDLIFPKIVPVAQPL